MGARLLELSAKGGWVAGCGCTIPTGTNRLLVPGEWGDAIAKKDEITSCNSIVGSMESTDLPCM